MDQSFGIMKVLSLTVMSMLIVFVCLVAIAYILSLFKVIFKEGEPKIKNTPKKSGAKNIETAKTGTQIIKDINEDAMVAVFTAAIAASNGQKASNVRIRSIKKLS